MENGDSLESVMNMTLGQLNDEKAKIYYGAIIFLGVLILPGVVGNLHVLHIYLTKKPHNNTRVYVCFLAVVDLVSCAICFPYNIANCLFPLTFYNDFACKVFTFLNSFVTMGAALSLLVIAVERYRKICKPFKSQITLKHAKISCILVLALATVFSLPIVFLYGSTEIPTKHPNITGHECYVYNSLQDTYFPTIYNGYILFVSSGLCSVLIVLYSMIGIRLKRQQLNITNMRSQSIAVSAHRTLRCFDASKGTSQSDDQTKITSLSRGPFGQPDDQIEITGQSRGPFIQTISNDVTSIELESGLPDEEDSYQVKDTEADSVVNAYSGVNKHQKRKRTDVMKKRELEKFNQLKKTTNMLCLITLFYILSYVPYPILRLYQIYNMDWYESLTYSGLVTFHLALCCLFLNNVANSFIYMLCDSTYRHELVSFYRNLVPHC